MESMGRTVLVVDDDRAIVDALAAVLEEEGLRVRTAYDGMSAFELVRREPPALVVSDIAMPGLDGVELAKRLRERAIPVVLLSAACPDPELAGVPFVPKPFDLDAVIEVVSRGLTEPADVGGDGRASGSRDSGAGGQW